MDFFSRISFYHKKINFIKEKKPKTKKRPFFSLRK